MTCIPNSRCDFCFVLPGEPHGRGCPVPGVHPLTEQPRAVPAAAPDVEERRARALDAWLRGGPVPLSTGRRIPEERPLP